MMEMKLRVNVGSTLRPEDFPTLAFIELRVEEIVSLVLQTVFDFAHTEVTTIDETPDEPEPPMDDSQGEQDMPDDLW